jgi:CheY-like chemotaxis protein
MSDAAKILIVDDDQDLVESLRLALEAAGFAVVSAPGPERGLERVKAERPDLILLDVMMPGGTEGFHFVWALRQDPDPGCRDLPIVMLTAIHDKTDLRFYPDSGDGTYQAGEYLPVQDFIDKPVDPAQLVARVRAVLAARTGR